MASRMAAAIWLESDRICLVSLSLVRDDADPPALSGLGSGTHIERIKTCEC